jgi:hypothetical protein
VKYFTILGVIPLLLLVNLSCRAQQKPFPVRLYSELEKLNISLPYIKYYGKDSSLLVYGSNHTTDYNDPQIADIQARISHFKPTLILYEGDGIATANNKVETVTNYFEMGLVKYLADSARIHCLNIEPPTKAKYTKLQKEFSLDEILLATLGLQITMMQIVNADFEKQFPAMVSALVAEGLPLSSQQQSLNYFYTTYKNYFKTSFSYQSFDSRNIQAKYNRTSLNRVNQRANEFRDQYIISLVEDLLKTGRVYLQIGGWHAIVCEPAFKKITDRE